jgi:flavin reductase (DIM6/NTAB) family NADH-FMN oxidoreductase RutF
MPIFGYNTPHMTEADHARQTLGRALGRVPSGIFILTTLSQDARPHAMLTSWVQQASFRPPTVSVAVGRDRAAGAAIRSSGWFALSVVPEGGTSLMKRYARSIPDGVDPFTGLEVFSSPHGLPVLCDALAWLECRLIGSYDFAGDHELLVGEVTAGDMLRSGEAFTHTRGSGFHY